MPKPAKRVAAQPGIYDQADLLAINEEKKAMVLTFGAGGLLCAVLIVSGKEHNEFTASSNRIYQ